LSLRRTVHALRWFTDEAFRRPVDRKFNKGGPYNKLRLFISRSGGRNRRFAPGPGLTEQ